MKKVLFVCTGNTCRSPMAAGIMKKAIAFRGIVANIASAGTDAVPGITATIEAIETCQRNQVNIRPHQTQLVTPELITDNDYVICMTQVHKQKTLALLQDQPQEQPKVFTLGELVDDQQDIQDPIGNPLNVYFQTYQELHMKIEKLLTDEILEF